MSKDIFDISLEWDDDEVIKAFKNATDEVVEAVERALIEDAEHLTMAGKALAPLDTGDLAGTVTRGEVEVEYDGTKAIKVGASVPYALKMHEDVYNPGPLTRSKPGIDGMKAGRKYLERPVKRYTKRYLENIANRVRERLR